MDAGGAGRGREGRDVWPGRGAGRRHGRAGARHTAGCGFPAQAGKPKHPGASNTQQVHDSPSRSGRGGRAATPGPGYRGPRPAQHGLPRAYDAPMSNARPSSPPCSPRPCWRWSSRSPARCSRRPPPAPPSSPPRPGAGRGRRPGAGARLGVRATPSSASGVECATAAVPLDYDEPTGATVDLDLARHVGHRPGQPDRDALRQPGRPGRRPSREFVGVLRRASSRRAVSDRFDIVGIDPRGVGPSAPMECRTDAKRPPFPRPSFPTTERQVRQQIRFDRWQRRACRDEPSRIVGHMTHRRHRARHGPDPAGGRRRAADLLRHLLRHPARHDVRRDVPRPDPRDDPRRRARPRGVDDRPRRRGDPPVLRAARAAATAPGSP